MLAQRAAKRAKASTGGEPPASAPRTPTLGVISLDDSPQRSLRFIRLCIDNINLDSLEGREVPHAQI